MLRMSFDEVYSVRGSFRVGLWGLVRDWMDSDGSTAFKHIWN